MSMLSKIKNLKALSKPVKTIRRFKDNEEGVTAVEFAIVGGPFFLLIFAIIETMLFFFAGQYLETVVDDVARLYRTGQLQSISSQDTLKSEICGRIVALFECDGIIVSLDIEDRFRDLPSPLDTNDASNFDDDGNFTPPERFDPDICPEKVLQLSASYEWPIFTNYSAPLVSEGLNNNALINVTAVVKTESFPRPIGSTCQ